MPNINARGGQTSTLLGNYVNEESSSIEGLQPSFINQSAGENMYRKYAGVQPGSQQSSNAPEPKKNNDMPLQERQSNAGTRS